MHKNRMDLRLLQNLVDVVQDGVLASLCDRSEPVQHGAKVLEMNLVMGSFGLLGQQSAQTLQVETVHIAARSVEDLSVVSGDLQHLAKGFAEVLPRHFFASQKVLFPKLSADRILLVVRVVQER